MNRCCQNSAEQADERAMSHRAPPEHAEKKRGEKRSVDESEHQLKQIHDVVEVRGEISRAHTNDDAYHGGRASHPQQRGIMRLWPQIRLINVVGPDSVERSHVASHPGHERRHQGGQTQAKNSRRKIMPQHERNDEIVVE